jgi:hypothetical protein
MQDSFSNSIVQQTESCDVAEPSSRSADRVYQTVTIAAILLLLGSLWVF